MELCFSEKFARLYEEEKGRNKLVSNKNFHLDCKHSRKKICTCAQNDSSLQNKDFSDFLTSLINNEIEIFENPENKKINYRRKDDEVVGFKQSRDKMYLEKIKNFDFEKTKKYLSNVEESKLLSFSDFREIEKSINDDKKICENCKTNIYENNYHKGWKNEAGEFVLLCSMCSKKYFNGALEIKFDRKEEMIPFNKVQTNNVMPSGSIYIKNDGVGSGGLPVTNASRPVEDPLLGQKRNLEAGGDMMCANKRCNKYGKRSDFLCCAKCEKFYHPICTEPPVIMKLASRFKWLCVNCKACQVCSGKDDGVMRCSTCDRTFHQKCYQMNVSPMNGKSYCKDCLNCKNCTKALPIISSYNQNDFVSIKGFRVCDDCWKYYKNKHYCPKCLKIYKQEEFQNTKIYCNKCLNWYHAECENLSSEEMKEKNKSKYSYTCSICRLN